MICQFARIINSVNQDFWKIPLEEMYQRLIFAVRARRSRFYIPSIECYCEAKGYILWGGYYREQIIDMQYVPCENGSWRYEKVKIKDFRIQRIREEQTGATHAVLNEFFVPFKQYSLRYILFHLRQFFNQRITQEAYCLENEIEVTMFQQWLKWLKDHIGILYGFGLTRDYSDNWRAMNQWLQEIAGNISDWTYNSLRKMNLALFQNRKMPENTMYRKYDRPG